jgi:GNAT superfamily N-acetyltransferase
MVSRGRVHDLQRLPGIVALLEGAPAGLATYRVVAPDCELTSINSVVEGCGVGSALVAEVARRATVAACKRLWLITTNDNTAALRWYQKRGFVLAALHRDGIVQARRLKPSIPLRGADGIPIRDELELELAL